MPYRINSKRISVTHFYQAHSCSIPASETSFKKKDGDLIFKSIKHNITMLPIKRFNLPAREVTTIISRGGKECKWNRKELIIDKASVD